MSENKKTVKELNAEAKRMNAINEAIKKFENMTKLTRDRNFLLMKSQALEKTLIQIDESSEDLFNDETQGMRLEFNFGYRDSLIKISNEGVIRAFIKFISEQMTLKIDEIDEQIIQAS